jgi:hypothetical protein
MATVHIDSETGLVAVVTRGGVRVLDHGDLYTAGVVMLACAAAGVHVTSELVWAALGCSANEWDDPG